MIYSIQDKDYPVKDILHSALITQRSGQQWRICNTEHDIYIKFLGKAEDKPETFDFTANDTDYFIKNHDLIKIATGDLKTSIRLSEYARERASTDKDVESIWNWFKLCFQQRFSKDSFTLETEVL